MAMRKCVGALLVLLLAVSVPMMAADTLAVLINDGEAYTSVREISIELTYQGIEIPTELRVSVAGEDAWSEWTEYVEAIDLTLTTGDGLKTVTVETRYWVESKTATTVYGGWHVVAGESSITFDTTPPMITVVRSQPNPNGWYNGPVTVTYNVFDTLSGVATVPESRTFSITSNVTLFPRATDRLGNTAVFGSLMLNIDIDDPSIVITDVSPGASQFVWTAGPVAISTALSDFSGIDSVVYVEGAETFAADGGAQIFSILVTDLAGNQSTATVTDINIDTVLPATTILLEDSEGLLGATADGPELIAVDLKAKLDAFGVYDSSNIALGFAFKDASDAPIDDLKVHATILKVGEGAARDEMVSFLLCEYAPAGGFYYMVLPEGLITGQEYTIWFEESNQAHSFKVSIIGL